jgi:CheY-like chemotaxis protein
MTTQTILIVDDELAIQNIIRRLLSRRGFEVLTAGGAAEARQILEDESVAVDLIISDYVMPGEDGLSFLAQIRGSHPDIVRVLLTGFADVRTAVKAINEAHVQHFIVKPFEAAELLQVIGDLLPHQTPQSSASVPQASPEPGRAGPHGPEQTREWEPEEATPRSPESVGCREPEEQRHGRREPPNTLMRLRQAHPGIDEVRRNTQGFIVLPEDEQSYAAPRTTEYDSVKPVEAGSTGDPRVPPDAAHPAPCAAAKQPHREPTFLRNLKRDHPAITKVRRSTEGRILIDDDELEALWGLDEDHPARGDGRADPLPVPEPARKQPEPRVARERPEPKLSAPVDPRDGSLPLDDWQDPTNPARGTAGSSARPDSEIVFDDALLKLIGG